jgi:hypothetical protein
MTATMDSSGGSFTVTPSSTYDFVADPLLCRVIFNVNPTSGMAKFIDPTTGVTVETGSSISYTSRDLGAFSLKKRSDAPTFYDATSRTIDLTTVFKTSADSIDNTYGAEWSALYSTSFKATGLTYAATYSESTMKENIRAYLPGYDVIGQTF